MPSTTRLAVLAALVAGCTGASGAQLVDVAASELEIRPTVIDADPAPADGKVPVVVQFFDGGAYVELAETHRVTCNGVALIPDGLGYAARVPIAVPGATLAIVHVRGGVTTQVDIVVPPRPEVTSPADGASLPRTAGLTIRYAAASSAGVTPAAGDTGTGVAGAEQPDSGTATLDVTGLRPGAGTVSIARRVVASPASTGFASVTATYTISSAARHVTWQ